MDVIASAITIASSALTLTVTITKIIRDIRRRDENVQELETKSEILGAVIREVQETYNINEKRRATLETAPLDENEVRILRIVKKVVECCNSDLERYKKELLKLLNARDRQNFILKTWREQVALPAFKRIADSIDQHYDSLQLLISLHQAYIQKKVLEGIEVIKSRLNAWPSRLSRANSEGTLVELSPPIEHENLSGSSDEGEELIGHVKPPEMPHNIQQTSENSKLLLQAVKDGPIEVLESFLSKSDTNLEETDEQGRTPLILAANLRKPHIVNKLLASQSIKINATDKLGRTALHYCVQMKMNETIELLFDHGADANIQDRGSFPPMYYAIRDDKYDIVKLLLDHHATTDFTFPAKPIPSSIKNLIEKYNTKKRMDPVSESSTVEPIRARTNSHNGPTRRGRRSSSLRLWKSTER